MVFIEVHELEANFFLDCLIFDSKNELYDFLNDQLNRSLQMAFGKIKKLGKILLFKLKKKYCFEIPEMSFKARKLLKN